MDPEHPSRDPLSLQQKHYFLDISDNDQEFSFQRLKNSPLSPAKLPSPNRTRSPVIQRSFSPNSTKHKKGGFGTFGSSRTLNLDEDGFSPSPIRTGMLQPSSPFFTSSFDSDRKSLSRKSKMIKTRLEQHTSQIINTREHLNEFPFQNGLQPSRKMSNTKRPESQDCFARFTQTLKQPGTGTRPLTGIGTMKRTAFANTELNMSMKHPQDGFGLSWESSGIFRPATMASMQFGAQTTSNRRDDVPLDIGSDQDIEAWRDRVEKQQLASVTLRGRWTKRRTGFSPRARTAPVLLDRATFPKFQLNHAEIDSVCLEGYRTLGSIFDGDWEKVAELQRKLRSEKKLDPKETQYYDRKEYFLELQDKRNKGIDTLFVSDKSDEAAFMKMLYSRKVGFVLNKRQALKKRCMVKWKTFIHLIKTFRRVYLYYKYLRIDVLQAWYSYAKRLKRIKTLMLDNMMGPVRLTYKAWKSYTHVHVQVRLQAKQKQDRLLFEVLHALHTHARERIAVKRRLASRTMLTLSRKTFEIWKTYTITQKTRREKALNSFLSGEAAVFHAWRRHTRNQKVNRRQIDERRRKAKKKVFDSWKFWANLAQKQRRRLIFQIGNQN